MIRCLVLHHANRYTVHPCLPLCRLLSFYSPRARQVHIPSSSSLSSSPFFSSLLPFPHLLSHHLQSYCCYSIGRIYAHSLLLPLFLFSLLFSSLLPFPLLMLSHPISSYLILFHLVVVSLSDGSMHTLVVGVLKHVDNLRSAVAKNALLTIGDMCQVSDPPGPSIPIYYP